MRFLRFHSSISRSYTVKSGSWRSQKPEQGIGEDLKPHQRDYEFHSSHCMNQKVIRFLVPYHIVCLIESKMVVGKSFSLRKIIERRRL